MTGGLRADLEKHIVSLYKELLLYQMRSVCSFSRNPVATTCRDMFEIDNWAGTVQSIKETEAVVQRDIDTYMNVETQKSLNHIAGLARDIHQAIQESAKKQDKWQQDDLDQMCIRDLRLTDPRDDKRRIEATKGGLYREASNWIFNHDDFQRWKNSDDARLLWIKGDPGKGKTMLLITIVDELERKLKQAEESPGGPTAVSYFFCQGTSKDLNNATAVLRGLIYLLAVQHPPLILHLRESYDHAGSKLFDDSNSFFALSKVLESMLRDKSLARAYVIIDALDECLADQERLIKLIIHNVTATSPVKWIISSRNRPGIEQDLKIESSGMKLSLELAQNAEQISQAVNAYIDFKIQELKQLQDNHDLRNKIRDILRRKANGTFLWVALVTKELEKAKTWRILKVVKKAPAGLHDLYNAMMAQIQQQEEDWELCQLVLSAATIAYRPLHLTELSIVSGLPKDISANTNHIREVVDMCGSFLTVPDDNFVYIIHQSAKDYLSSKASSTIFSSGPTDVHLAIFSRSLQAMQEILNRDIYNLRDPGLTIKELKIPDPDPLAAMRYSCVYWANHFCDSYNSNRPKDQVGPHAEPVFAFLRQYFLCWLEALGLMRHIGDGVLSMIRLESLLKVSVYLMLCLIMMLINLGTIVRWPIGGAYQRLTPVHSPE